MTKEQYIEITRPLRQDAKKAGFVAVLNKILTGMVFCIYPLYLVLLFVTNDAGLWKAVLVPGVSFALVTVFRKVVNFPRPYEKFELPPILEKDTKGKSFPSRHVFSAFVIAMTIYWNYPMVGIALMVAGAAMALIRVIGGVHEPRDVVAGALVGIFAGSLVFFL